MKKSLGVLTVALCFLVAGVLNVFGSSLVHGNNGAKQVSATSYFSGMYTQFKLFEQSNGIFVLKEEDAGLDNVNEFFTGGISLTRASGWDEQGRAYVDYLSLDWYYEAVVRDTFGVWTPTEMLQFRVQSGRKSVVYDLPKSAVPGDYGIRVTAYDRGVKLVDKQKGVVTGIYVIKYAEELGYMFCADHTGSSFYNVYATGNGLGTTIPVRVLVNPGAVRADDLAVYNVEDYKIGNLVRSDGTDVGLSLASLDFHFENVSGEILLPELGWILPTVEKDFINGRLNVTLPIDLYRMNYVLRVYHKASDQVFATYIIQNGGVYYEPSDSSGIAPTLAIAGLVLCVVFGVMFMMPKIAVGLQNMKYQSIEQKRFSKSVRAAAAEDWYDLNGKKLTPEEIEKLTDEEREAIVKHRAAAAKETRSGRFLGKMAENRQKREIARESGLTMEEFNELENRLKKEENLKEVSLASFRKALEDKGSSIITKHQEEELEASRKAAEAKQPMRETGTPEFEMLDSMKGNAAVEQVVAAQTGAVKKEEKSGSILERLKKLTGEDDENSFARQQEEAERRRQAEVEERKKREEESARRRQIEEQEESERKKQQEEEERKRQEEARKAQEEESEKKRQIEIQEEADKRKQAEEEEKRRQKEEADRQKQEEAERKKQEKEEEKRKREEELEKKKQEKEEEKRRLAEESENKKREKSVENKKLQEDKSKMPEEDKKKPENGKRKKPEEVKVEAPNRTKGIITGTPGNMLDRLKQFSAGEDDKK